jgi:hypothetical protein
MDGGCDVCTIATTLAGHHGDWGCVEMVLYIHNSVLAINGHNQPQPSSILAYAFYGFFIRPFVR